MNAAVIVAAGRGTRMGLERNKVLAPLCGEPVIARTVRAFERTGWFDGGIVVVTGACDLGEMKRILADAGLHAQVVLGGADRQESVCRGLAATNPEAQYVAIHDGARPLVTAEVSGLPENDTGFFAFHIHEGSDCGGTDFSDTGGHYNPDAREHPRHAGDLPPLLSMAGRAFLAVETGRFTPCEVVGRTVVIHGSADDFHTQPAGNAGKKIACGVIRRA